MSKAGVIKHANVARAGSTPLQAKPANAKYSPLAGPSYVDRTRQGSSGMYKPAAENEGPHMMWRDEFRSVLGYLTWKEGEGRPMRPGKYGDPDTTWNYAMDHVRAAKTLHTSMHGLLEFQGRVPGVAVSNPAAVYGDRMLSKKFTPLEMADDGLLFVHPSQRELLTWTQDQLREDAKANGDDVDGIAEEKIEQILQHEPVQPDYEIAMQRKKVMWKAREEIIRQESRMHERRVAKGLPVPPLLMPQYSHQYPEKVGGPSRVPLNMMFHKMTRGWEPYQRIGQHHVKLSPAATARINRRHEQYMKELADQGIEVAPVRRPAARERLFDPYAEAQKRAEREFGTPIDVDVDEVVVPED